MGGGGVGASDRSWLLEGVSPSVLLVPAQSKSRRLHVSGWLTSLRGGKPRQLCGGCLELLCFLSGPRGGGK